MWKRSGNVKIFKGGKAYQSERSKSQQVSGDDQRASKVEIE
jgi:hypothetical protein